MPERAGGLRLALLGVIFVVLAIALAAVALTAERQERRLRDGSVKTTAQVVARLARGPLVRFVTASGDHVDVTIPAGGLRSPAAGETVPVYYHPDNPSFAGLDTPVARWFRTAASGFLAIVSAAIGARLLRLSQRA